jgi:hypothetical protein
VRVFDVGGDAVIRVFGASTGIAGMSKIRMSIGFFGLAEKRYRQKYRQIQCMAGCTV